MNRIFLPVKDGSVIGQEIVQLSTSRPVQVQECELAVPIALHGHEFTEFVLVQHGSVRHQILDKEGATQHRELQSGDFLIVPLRPQHAYGILAPGQACQLINIYYLSEWFLWDLNLLWNEGLVPLFFASHLFRRPEFLQIWQFQLSDEEMAVCVRELQDISAEYLQPTPSLLFIRGAFVKILVVLARAWRHQTSHGDLHFRPEVWRALQNIDTHIKAGRTFRVDTFARAVGLAPGSFSRMFHATTGFSASGILWATTHPARGPPLA